MYIRKSFFWAITAASFNFDRFTLGFTVRIQTYRHSLQQVQLIPTSLTFHATSSTSTLLQVEKGTSISFQYSPSALKHLEAVDLPPDYSRPWTKEKVIAIAGAFMMGGIFFATGSTVATALWGNDQAGILTGGVGIAIGYYLFGGQAVIEAEKDITDKNGGYDAKLVADRPARLQTVLEDLGKANKDVRVKPNTGTRDLSRAKKYIQRVHGDAYSKSLEIKCSETDRPVRFNPLYCRTLIDENSYDAAVEAVEDWIDGVDAALEDSARPIFSLSRPPGHHACKSKGMGGCLFNNAAIAAFYALDQGARNVAILDFDAHHGNGIAHCVQDEPRIRYCSIHEGKDGSKASFIEQKIPEDDPRTQDADDKGPLGNLCNINLNTGTGWNNGYKVALLETAMPFLVQNNPEVLIVSAGFDALETDWSSGLLMQPIDYKGIGQELKTHFGDKVVMGLEGGYSYQNHALSDALMEFCGAWDE